MSAEALAALPDIDVGSPTTTSTASRSATSSATRACPGAAHRLDRRRQDPVRVARRHPDPDRPDVDGQHHPRTPLTAELDGSDGRAVRSLERR